MSHNFHGPLLPRTERFCSKLPRSHTFSLMNSRRFLSLRFKPCHTRLILSVLYFLSSKLEQLLFIIMWQMTITFSFLYDICKLCYIYYAPLLMLHILCTKSRVQIEIRTTPFFPKINSFDKKSPKRRESLRFLDKRMLCILSQPAFLKPVAIFRHLTSNNSLLGDRLWWNHVRRAQIRSFWIQITRKRWVVYKNNRS